MATEIKAERRVMRVSLPARFVIREFHRMIEGWTPHYVELLEAANLPEGTKLIGGPYQNPGGMAFYLYIHHPSFPEVPEGLEPPDFHDPLKMRVHLATLAVPVPEDQIKKVLTDLFSRLGVHSANRYNETGRWSNTDLATDLAPLLAEALNQGIVQPTPLPTPPPPVTAKTGITAKTIEDMLCTAIDTHCDAGMTMKFAGSRLPQLIAEDMYQAMKADAVVFSQETGAGYQDTSTPQGIVVHKRNEE